MESQPQNWDAQGAQALGAHQEPISYPSAETASAHDIPSRHHHLRILGHSVPKWKAPSRHSVTFYFSVALIIAVGLAGLIFMLPFLAEHGIGITIGLTLLALLPVIVIVSLVMWIDNWEREPLLLYAVAFVWGAGVSTILSLISNEFFGEAAASRLSENGASIVSAVVVAPLVEEAFKGVGILVILLFFSKNFNGPVDGIVYGMLVGLGFAFTENILYFSMYYEDLAYVFRARAILNPFVHPLATSMTGFFVGLSLQQRSKKSLFYLAPTGYVIAVGLHALHNLSAALEMSDFTRLLYQIPVYLVAIGIIIGARVAERRDVMAALREYGKAGWITQNELSMIESIPNRRQAVLWARNTVGQAGGDPDDGEESMRRFQDELVQLGYARSRNLHRGVVNLPETRQEEAERLALIGQLRKVFTGKYARGLA